MMEFEESGMIFEFDPANCFRVEEDPLVKRSQCASTSNIKACECVSYINGVHCFIEAKSSAPKMSLGNKEDLRLNGKIVPPTWEIYDNYQHFLRDISKKFQDSFYILRSLTEGVHGEEGKKRVTIEKAHVKKEAIRFILVLNFQGKPVDKQGLATLQDALKNEMRPFLNLWKISDTSVKVAMPEDASRILRIPVKVKE